MITLSNNGKSIHLALANDITVAGDDNFQVNSPVISCTTEKDAVQIQMKLNEFINNLSREVLNEK